MRLAAMFQEPDVEALKARVDADQWARWQQFEAIEPSGWRGLQSVAGYIAYHVCQAAAPRAKLDYTKFAPRFVVAEPANPKLESIRMRAWCDAQNAVTRK